MLTNATDNDYDDDCDHGIAYSVYTQNGPVLLLIDVTTSWKTAYRCATRYNISLLRLHMHTYGVGYDDTLRAKLVQYENDTDNRLLHAYSQSVNYLQNFYDRFTSGDNRQVYWIVSREYKPTPLPTLESISEAIEGI